MTVLLLLGCATSTTTTTRFETNDVVECLEDHDADACYRAAIADPNRTDLGVLLSRPCEKGIADACKRAHTFHQENRKPSMARSMAVWGCQQHDLEMCDALEKTLDDPAFAAGRDFTLKILAEGREQPGPP